QAKPSATTASSSRKSAGGGSRSRDARTLTRRPAPRLIAPDFFSFMIGGVAMLTLYYGPGACSMASHIVLEESGEKYEPRRMDLAKGEQRTPEYLKMNPQGRVPLLQLDNGEPLAENTAILPYLGKRFTLWPTDPIAE